MFLEEFLNFIGYKLTSGEKYYWNCFGKNARYIESDEVDSKNGFVRALAIFDTETKFIYQLESYDDRENIGYLWIDPFHREAHRLEAIAKGVNPNEMYDDVEFRICETAEEWNEKTLELFEGKESEEYDNPIKDNLIVNITDFVRNHYDIYGDDVKTQVKRYVNNLYGKELYGKDSFPSDDAINAYNEERLVSRYDK
jgi:hypothetical protein